LWCERGRRHPHNLFLFFWVEHGIVGVLLLIAFGIMPLVTTWKSRPEIRGLAGAFSGIYFVTGMLHGSLWLSTESHFMIFIGSLLFAEHKMRLRQ
jgi:O-antigen ligase